MKVDITTTIVATIIGLIVAYLLTTNVILKNPTPVVVKALNESIPTDLSEPNPEVFNYRALNPTVEVYIDCTNYDASGSCINHTENK